MNKKDILLSIIIPVYNVEKYLKACLDSIFSNNSSLYEIIIINDGTKDNSMEIVQEFKNKYKDKITVINQENQGLSTTRNNGIHIALGKYIWFIDSDDYLENNAIIEILEEIKRNDPEVIAMPIIYNYSNGEKANDVLFMTEEIITGKEYITNKYPYGASVRFLLKKDFVIRNNLFFIPNLLHEDGEFGLRMLYYAKQLKPINKAYYNYRIQESGSIMSSWKEKNSKDLIFISSSLRNLFITNPLKTDNTVFFDAIFRILYASISFAENKWETKQFRNFYHLHKKTIRNEAMKIFPACTLITQSKILLFILSPLFYVQKIQSIKKFILK